MLPDVGTKEDLARYRLERAKEDLEDAKTLLEKGSYRSATNRAYYAVFHTINALHALDGMGFKRHKDVIGNFNKNYVKTKVFPSDYGRRVSFLEQARRESDYMDYHIPNEDEARSHFSFAVEFVGVLTKYIEAKLNEVKKC